MTGSLVPTHDVLRMFEAVAADTQKEWARSQCRLEALPDAATAALERARLPSNLSLPDVLAAYATSHRIAQQPLLGAGFGDPAMTLATCGALHVDVYCWYEDSINIHDHTFTGAFQVLGGLSLHSQFAFAVQHEIDRHLTKGELSTVGHELLRVGAIRPITSSTQVHAVYHLSRPSATIVVRTHCDSEAMPQHVYARSGLRLPGDGTSKGQGQALLATATRATRSLLRVDVERGLELFDRLIGHVPIAAAFQHLRALANVAGIESPGFRATAERFARAYPPHGASLLPDLRELARTRELSSEEAAVDGEGPRILLGALMNVATRAELDTLVRDYAPGRPTGDVIVEWLRSLTATGAVKLAGPLGGLVELMIQGHHDEAELTAALRQRGPSETLSGLEGKVAVARDALRRHPTFRVLFS